MNEPSILAVDDEPLMLRTLERILTPRYRLQCARTLREAMLKVQERPPALVILDLRMTDADGFQVLAEIRRVHADFDVIFMTGAVHALNEQLIRAIREGAFYFAQKPFDRDLLLTLVERCFQLRRLQDENRVYLKRLEAELDEARAFQRSVMPAEADRIHGYGVDARWLPCESVGGDFFDYVDDGAGGIAMLIADVSGHGVSAAMMTSVIKSAFHDAHHSHYQPLDVIQRISSGLRGFPPERFITALCLRAQPDGHLEYVNAGHPSAMLNRDQHLQPCLERTGPLISPVFLDVEWTCGSLHLPLQSRLFLYTDGLVDTPGLESRLGEARFTKLVFESSQSQDGLLPHLLQRLDQWSGARPRDDDWTMLLLTRQS